MPSYLSEDEVGFSGKWRQRKDEISDSDWISTDDDEEDKKERNIFI